MMHDTRYAAMKTTIVTGSEVNVGANQVGLIYSRDSYSKT